MEFIFAGIILLALLLALFFIIRFLWSNGKYGRMFLAIGIGGFTWVVYDSIFPSKSFYLDEIESLTSVKIPYNVKLIYKSATYPDMHGAYSACTVISIPQDKWDQLVRTVNYKYSYQTKYDGCWELNEKSKLEPIFSTRYDLKKSQFQDQKVVNMQYLTYKQVIVISWHVW